MAHHLHTIAAHAGRVGSAAGLPVTSPISLSTTFIQAAPGQYEAHAYSRVGNPTRDALECTLASLEAGLSAAAFSSGCAAMHAALQLLAPGDHLVACADIYGGTYRLIEQLVGPMGVETSWVDMSDLAAVEQSMRESTRMLWIETPTNPLLRVFDIRALSDVAGAYEAITVVDNTFATPMLQRPLELGADLVVHSLSKYLNGHSDVLAGALVSKQESLMERVRLIQRAGGAVLAPFDAYLVARGIKTLPLRMERHCENALRLATWLRDHPRVETVHYPGLSEHPDHELASHQMRAYGGVVSFVVRGGLGGAGEVLRRVRLFSLAESLGGVESLIGQPARMSHASMPADVRRARGVQDGLIRASVGIEAFEDLRSDLDQALTGA
jgi:cystathionine beta-lyase/cystathionine gamma-synthase